MTLAAVVVATLMAASEGSPVEQRPAAPAREVDASTDGGLAAIARELVDSGAVGLEEEREAEECWPLWFEFETCYRSTIDSWREVLALLRSASASGSPSARARTLLARASVSYKRSCAPRLPSYRSCCEAAGSCAAGDIILPELIAENDELIAEISAQLGKRSRNTSARPSST